MSGFARKVQRNQMRAAKSGVRRFDQTGKRQRKLSDFLTVPKAMMPGQARARRRAVATELRKQASGRKT